MGYHTDYYGHICFKFLNDDVAAQFQQLLVEINQPHNQYNFQLFTYYNNCFRIESCQMTLYIIQKIPLISQFIQKHINDIEKIFGNMFWKGQAHTHNDSGIIWMTQSGIHTKCLDTNQLIPDPIYQD